MIFKLAWRNIWRNKRRTYITAASILFAVLLASLMESLQKGAWDNMIGNVVNFYIGYAQIHQKGYWEDQSLDQAIPFTAELKNIPKEVSEVKNVLPRMESFALASTGNTTMGALVVGIDPEVENRMTQLQTRLRQGAYLNATDKAALVAEGVADNLNLKVGDTLVLVSQGYHGVNAAGKYPVKGIIHLGSPELNKQMVYLPLHEAQWFFGAEGLITSLALHIERPGDVTKAVKAVKAKLNLQEYEVSN